MSFILNKVASLLATVVVVGIVLLCSSAAQAHGNHGSAASDMSMQVAADIKESQVASDVGGEKDTQTISTRKDGRAGGHRFAGFSCCETGMSNCMAAVVTTAVEQLQAPPSGTYGRTRQGTLLLGSVVDGLDRPPRAHV